MNAIARGKIAGSVDQVSIRDLERSSLYSEELGIDLSSADRDALFRWFLASLL